MKTYFEHKKL
jgi:hypothetical protein